MPHTITIMRSAGEPGKGYRWYASYFEWPKAREFFTINEAIASCLDGNIPFQVVRGDGKVEGRYRPEVLKDGSTQWFAEVPLDENIGRLASFLAGMVSQASWR